MKFLEIAAILGLLAAAPHPTSAPTSSPNTSSHCGEAVWTIFNQKRASMVFNGKADCTTVESNPMLTSIMDSEGGRLSLSVRYDASGELHCGGPDVTVTLSGVSAPPGLNQTYSAGQGNVSPPGSSCDLSISDLPRGPGVVRGGLKAVLGRCVVVGGCAKPSDWDLVTVNGSFNAHFRGRD